MVLIRSFYICVCLVFISACTSSSNEIKSGPPETPEVLGENLFIMNCAACHGDDGKLGASGAKDLTMSRLTDNEIVKILTEGKNSMPSMKANLETKKNMDLVIAHIKKLRH
jgi:mono/diheme cytochrome c family protein